MTWNHGQHRDPPRISLHSDETTENRESDALRERLTLALPQELIDHIVDQLSSDTASLKVASLISRVFLPQTRSHLFRSYSVKSQKSCEIFKLVIGTSLAVFIQDLEISTFIGISVPKRLSNVRSVSFSDILYISDPFIQGLTRCTAIHTVALLGPSLFIYDLRILQDFIRAFPCLHSLELRTYMQARSWTIEPAFRLEVEEIVLVMQPGLRPFLELIVQGPSLVVARKMTVTAADRGDIPVLSALLNVAVDTLQELAFHCTADFQPDEDVDVLDLKSVQTLRCDTGSAKSPIQKWWCKALRAVQLGSCALETLYVTSGDIGTELLKELDRLRITVRMTCVAAH